MSPALTVSPAEMETGLRLFADSVALIAGGAAPILEVVSGAGAMDEVEAAG
jgi:hypothetical protein